MQIVKNMGLTDRLVRIFLAVALLILNLTGIISGTAGWIISGLAAIFLLTSLVGTCPLYFPFGIRTLNNK